MCDNLRGAGAPVQLPQGEDFWERAVDGLGELYQLLGEEDLAYGLWQRRCTLPITRTALHLEQHGLWQKAQVHTHIAPNQNAKEPLQFALGGSS
jgi:hypothetical protein